MFVLWDLTLNRAIAHTITVCPRSLDPFYIVTYFTKLGQDFLAIWKLPKFKIIKIVAFRF